MLATLLGRLDSLARPALVRMLPPRALVKLYSAGRHVMLERFVRERPAPYAPAATLARTVWGVHFRAPLFNAAGMFKNGEGYEVIAAQGAGAYLAGTTTAAPREGNRKEGIAHPFAPYPRSRAASNWLGLPNLGHRAVAERLAKLVRVPGCPVGVSVSGSPELPPKDRLAPLLEGLAAYADAGVDFIELNESCPNTEAAQEQHELEERLQFISERFFRRAPRPPVIVKFSTDTAAALVPALVEALVRRGFDGVNFGNTSTAYAAHSAAIAAGERALFEYFTGTFGGGLSGAPLRAPSLRLVSAAKDALAELSPDREFHIIRTGGVESAADLAASLSAGATLVEWYTGYFEAFAREGHAVYAKLFQQL